MGYMNISNLYRSQDILLFCECFALEKIHGTSCHINWDGGLVTFFSGGVPHEKFVELFKDIPLVELFTAKLGNECCRVHGEGYGGRCQGMSDTYGNDLKFIAFDVKVGESWLAVPQAEALAKSLGFEFVHYVKIPTTLEAIDAERDAPSVQAKRNGITEDKPREGVVLRPLIELRKNNGERIISKHKGEAFAEHRRAPKVLPAGQLEVLHAAEAVADQWVVPMRLEHILQEHPGAAGLEDTGTIIRAMLADVHKEDDGTIVWSKAVEKAISKKAAELWKQRTCVLPTGVGVLAVGTAAAQPPEASNA